MANVSGSTNQRAQNQNIISSEYNIARLRSTRLLTERLRVRNAQEIVISTMSESADIEPIANPIIDQAIILENKITELSLSLVKFEQTQHGIDQELQEILADKNRLKSETGWRRHLLRSHSRQHYLAQLSVFKQKETVLNNMKQSALLAWQRTKIDIDILQQQLTKLEKTVKAEKIIKETEKAIYLLKEQSYRETRAEKRSKIVQALTGYSSKFSSRRMQVLSNAEEQASELMEEAQPSSLLSKKTQSQALAQFYATSILHMDNLITSANVQRAEIQRKCPWYKCRTKIDKKELQEIQLVIRLVKTAKNAFLQTQKVVLTEQKRLIEQEQKLKVVIKRLQKMQARGEPKYFKAKYHNAVAKLQTKQRELEEDNTPKICFRASSSVIISEDSQPSSLATEQQVQHILAPIVIPADQGCLPKLVFHLADYQASMNSSLEQEETGSLYSTGSQRLQVASICPKDSAVLASFSNLEEES